MTRYRGPHLTPALLVVAIAMSTVGLAADPDPFPEFPAIRGNVEFWKRVWSEWSLGQVAVHDIRQPALVYEIATIPGPVAESYTREQRDWIANLRDGWKERLARIEAGVAAGETLDDADKKIVLALTTTLGTDALAGASERVRTQRGLRERFKRGIEISGRYNERFRRIFRDAGLPEDLAYLPHVESSFQAAARSSAGAVGIWQFTRGAGHKYLQITSSLDERLDPIAAAHGAAAYLRDAWELLGDWPIALTSYNHGVGGMRKAVERFGPDYERVFLEFDGRTFGFASKNFYAEFLAAREIASAPERYFPEGLTLEAPFNLDIVILEGRATPAAVARGYHMPLDELASLNPGWSRRAVQDGLALPAGTVVWMPREALARVVQSGSKPDLAGTEYEGLYVVRRGDNLSSIASAHNMTLDELRNLNGMASGSSVIRVGERLRVALHAGPAWHVVERGETLSGIAKQYRMSVEALRDLNDMPRGSSLIRVGQKLVVTEVERTTHVVASGETLTQIAQRYGVRLADLLSMNGLSISSLIRPGQALVIPARL